MSPRTDDRRDQRPELSTEYLISLVGAAALVLLLIFVIMPMTPNPMRIRGPLPWLYAWILAASQTIRNALTEFSGGTPELVDNSLWWAALGSLVLVGIVAPTITLQLMRSRSAEAAPRGSQAVYLFGLIISLTFAFTVVPTSLIGSLSGMRLREAQSVQSNMDRMINDVNTIAVKVREYKILPKSLGGGEGSAEGFVLAPGTGQTEEGLYVVTPKGGSALIEASSRKVSGASIIVTVDEHGSFAGWTYGGKFQ